MVSIIILSYNTRDLLHECLTALLKKLSGMHFEVIVLDNSSLDGSVEMVKKEFPQCKLIESPINLGFAKGINKAAEKAKGEYLLFLNSDAMLLDDNLKVMLSRMKSDPGVAVIGGHLLNKDNSTSSSFDTFYLLPEVFRLLFLPRRAPHAVSERIVDWVSGGFMLIRESVFRDIHGFDEHFFMYMEDMELCYRIQKKGLQVLYFPDAKARHVGQGSSNRSFAIIHIFRGLRYFYQKHRTLQEQVVVQLLMLIKSLGGYTAGVVFNKPVLRKTYRQTLSDLV